MNNFFTHLQNEANRIRLTDAEKQQMRVRVHTALSLPPSGVKSPYQRLFFPHVLAYSFIGILVIGSGTAYAAQGSLPNSPLYPIKIHMNEPVETALALSPEARAEVNARIAGRRIREVEMLAEKGTLDATTTAEVKQNFDYHTAQVATFVTDSRHKDTAAFAERTATSLDTLGTTLTKTGEHGKNEETKKNSKNFAEHVRASSQKILDMEMKKISEEKSSDSE